MFQSSILRLAEVYEKPTSEAIDDGFAWLAAYRIIIF